MICTSATACDDDETIVTSNVSAKQVAGFAPRTSSIDIDDSHGIADTGATSVFVKEGIQVPNKQPAMTPLTINLPDGTQVKSTHTCDVVVPGLPTPLVGHIVPHLAIASLFGIRPLCNAGCVVVFHKDRVDMWYNGKIILVGPRNMSTDLWTLPITGNPRQLAPSMPTTGEGPTHPSLASFTHSVRTRMNAVRFAHQALGNPKISTLLKAVQQGFLKGCPNILEKLILKYLNPSPATAKGHMKRPRHGIQSTTQEAIMPWQPVDNVTIPAAINDTPIHMVQPPLSAGSMENDETGAHPPQYGSPTHHLIEDNDSDPSVANIFAFGAFADKHSGVVYNDLTGSFPFMSLDGSVCFSFYTTTNQIASWQIQSKH